MRILVLPIPTAHSGQLDTLSPLRRRVTGAAVGGVRQEFPISPGSRRIPGKPFKIGISNSISPGPVNKPDLPRKPPGSSAHFVSGRRYRQASTLENQRCLSHQRCLRDHSPCLVRMDRQPQSVRCHSRPLVSTSVTTGPSWPTSVRSGGASTRNSSPGGKKAAGQTARRNVVEVPINRMQVVQHEFLAICQTHRSDCNGRRTIVSDDDVVTESCPSVISNVGSAFH